MVRLTDSSIEEFFKRKRKDIRYAITHQGFCRDRSAHSLPSIPAAPALSNPLFVRKSGTSVLSIEHSGRDVVEKANKNIKYASEGIEETVVKADAIAARRRNAPLPPDSSSPSVVWETEREEIDDPLMYSWKWPSA
jgi:hypothetical protein